MKYSIKKYISFWNRMYIAFKSSHIVPDRKTDVILYDVAA